VISEATVKELIVPVVASVVTGVAASVVATQVAISVLETKVGYLEKNIETMAALMDKANANQLELATRAGWMFNKDEKDIAQDIRLDRLEERTAR